MLRIFSQTDVGLVRNNNEDYHFTDLENRLLIVADGVGGHDDGEVASRVAVESCYQYLTREDYLHDTSNIPQTLVDSITFANHQVIEYKQKHMPGSNMGTTLSLVHVGDNEISFAWMGDSRIYHFRKGSGELVQISIDHTVYQEMLDRGEVAQSYKKSILSRMLGSNPYNRPDGDKLEIQAGDLLLLCSDGLSDLVPEIKMQDVFKALQDTPEALCGKLIDMAKNEGGRDNITVAIAVNE
jgi:serine/threonine protein phosphatase PrpC